MGKLIFLSFAFLAFAFFAMSGGTEFDPDEAREARISARLADNSETVDHDTVNDARAVAQSRQTFSEPVTRLSLNLTSFEDIVDESQRRRAPVATRPATQEAPQVDTVNTPQETVPSLTASTEIVLPSIIFPGRTSSAASSGAFGSTDIRTVAGANVNLRDGPSTDFAIVDRLNQGEKVEILDDPGNGWVQLRPLEGGPVGWMADFLLSGS